MDDDQTKAPVSEPEPLPVLTHVRMKHADPTASITAAGEPDATGGFMVPMDMLDGALAGGFFIAHTDEPEADPEADPAAEPAAATASGKTTDEPPAAGTNTAETANQKPGGGNAAERRRPR